MQCIVRNVTEIFFISKLFSTMRFLFFSEISTLRFYKNDKENP